MADKPTGNGPVTALRAKLAQVADEIRKTMPAQSPVSFESLAAAAISIVAHDARIRDACSTESIVKAVARAARLGLHLDPVLGHAYLKPRWNKALQAKECVMEMGYRGLAELAMRSGRISHVVARCVHERDEFEMDLANDRVRHVPFRGGNRGDVTEVYGRITFANGHKLFDLLTREDVEKIRAASDMPNGATWSEWWEEMAKKSAIRRILKNVPMCPDAQRGAIEDEYTDAGVDLDKAAAIEREAEGESGATAAISDAQHEARTPDQSSLAREGQRGAEGKTPETPAAAPARPADKPADKPSDKPAAQSAAELLPKARDLVGRMNADQRARAQKDTGLADLRALRSADVATVQKFITACERAMAA